MSVINLILVYGFKTLMLNFGRSYNIPINRDGTGQLAIKEQITTHSAAVCSLSTSGESSFLPP